MRTPVAVVALALSACSMTMRIPRSQLEADMAKRFPVEVDKHVVTLLASEPAIEFLGKRDELALRLHVRVTSLTGNSQLDGTTRVEGRIEYASAEHAFYLRDPRVTELALANRHVGARLVERAARAGVEQVLRAHPIYRLDARRSEKEAKAIRHLRAVHIDGDDLVLDVGW
jgi:hypothetical protein